MFASMSEDGRTVLLTVKLTAEEREIATRPRDVEPAARARRGRYGWVTAEVTDDEVARGRARVGAESYWLKAPAELRVAVEVHD